MLRILSGEFRSRPLLVPRGRDLTRPMGSRTREGVFNLLRGWFDGATVLDIFSGIGTLGLEAVSRGAARVACIEHDRTIARLLRANVAALECADRVTIIEGDALVAGTIAAVPRPVQVVFCDPPFDMVESEREAPRLSAMLARLRPLFEERGFMVLRLPTPQRGDAGQIPGFAGPEIHGYGDQQWVHLDAPVPSTP